MKPVRKLFFFTLCMILIFSSMVFSSCAAKDDDKTAATSDEIVSETTPEPTPEPTDPPTTTQKPTEPPTEPPTDPDPLPEADANTIVSGMRYYLQSPNSSLYLTVDGNWDYANLTQEEFTGKPDQMFVFEMVEENRYTIHPLGTTDKYLDVEEGIDENGKKIEATKKPNVENSQLWRLTPRKVNNEVQAITIYSIVANNKCIDVNGVSKDPGAYVHVWEGGTADNQKWVFIPVKDMPAE